jgi:hypothetical protein
LRELSKLRDFSENRSVLSPFTLATIAEGSSLRRKQLYFSCLRFCDWNFQSQKGIGIFIVIQHLFGNLFLAPTPKPTALVTLDCRK